MLGSCGSTGGVDFEQAAEEVLHCTVNRAAIGVIGCCTDSFAAAVYTLNGTVWCGAPRCGDHDDRC